jgi:phage recombination protein Bet
MSKQVATNQSSLIATFGSRYGVDETLVLKTLKSTAFKQTGNKDISNEQMIGLLVVANEYNLNPFTKEIYAFESHGGINPIVSIDGWMKIINSHPDMDGMEFSDNIVDKSLVSITCSIFRKGRSHPTTVTEYFEECKKPTEPWKKWPARMLRHKAAIQCARYAFSLSGISDPDEADRIQEGQNGGVIDTTGTVVVEGSELRTAAQIKEIDLLIESSERTPEQCLNYINSAFSADLGSFDDMTERQAEKLIFKMRAGAH